MSRINVTCVVPSLDDPQKTDVRIHSHWRWHELVTIQVGDEERTVDAADLIAAVENATNTNSKL